MIDSSPGAAADRSSYPSETKPEPAPSARDSPVESEVPRVAPTSVVPRKAYMDLNDAIALLDETCPNQEPSPSLTPRTPRTPLTPHPRNKRARSKSSDNSSNYSNERLSDRSFEKEVKEKKRPFLKKIGVSKTEDKPFLAKLAPRIIGKPYLEKIGPSKAVEKPFLEKIGSSKTLDKFVFDTSRYEKKSEEITTRKSVMGQSFDVQRRKSSKSRPLLKMYSFETEDLESTVQPKETSRDPLRGASLDDVLDSGPSSLPLETTTEEATIEESPESKPDNDRKEQVRNGAELLKCRVTTSEEIIFSNTSFGSDKEPNSWGNSPRKRWQLKRDVSTPRTHARRRVVQNSSKSRDSVPNSPTKRPISSGREDPQADTSEKNLYSPLKTRRQTYEDIAMDRNEDQDEKSNKQAQFERRGISSDNLLPRDRTLSTVDYQTGARANETREASSEDSLTPRTNQEYTKETFKQLQDKFRCHEIPTETYADFKRRTKGNLEKSIIGRQLELKASDGVKDIAKPQTEEPPKKESAAPESKEPVRVRSVLKKQQGIDHLSDQESDTNSSVRRHKRRMFHELSQETTDLLTELRKVKSLLKTPSWEKDFELDKKPVRQAKRILLTDKEFCLSVERENSIRRPSRVIDTFDNGKKSDEKPEEPESKVAGPALFEKKCLSLDYADEEKPAKPEPRAISLASTRNLPSETEDQLACDAKSYSSDVFNTPSDETKELDEAEKDVPGSVNHNHCTEIDIAIPIDQKASPKGIQIQSRTSDLYEIISPRATPFRVRKKRLGKISVEESIKPESFTLGSKVDCRSTVNQKRTKCFPL